MQYRESETIELKKSTSELKDAVISIAAILNKHGRGKLYFGIKNNGTVIGQQVSEATLREISRAIADHIDPKIYPKIYSKIIKGKSCILVEFEGDNSPYFAYGRAYMRVADENRQLSVKELERLMLKKSHYRSFWESEDSGLPIKEADAGSIKQFIKRSNAAERISYRYDNVRNVLNKLGLIHGKHLLNAARVLFSRNNMAEVQAAVFAGNDKLTFLDIRSSRGNLFELIKISEQYIKEHINWRAEIKDFKRREIPEIPIEAIREAIINSFCHRDFANLKGNEVAIFKNRIEIFNPGRFPEDYSPQDFIKGAEHSILRNPLIANVFFLTSDIERWGSGLKRIYTACNKAGVKVEFKNLKSGFLVTFYRPEATFQKGFQKSTQKTVEKTAEKTREKKLAERLAEGLVERLVESQRKMLDLIKENPYVSKKELSNKIGISTTAIDKNIHQLKKKGLLQRIGPDKGGHWEILNNKL